VVSEFNLCVSGLSCLEELLFRKYGRDTDDAIKFKDAEVYNFAFCVNVDTC
jgi:hypothetical protein